jgi:hypothetical protein
MIGLLYLLHHFIGLMSLVEMVLFVLGNVVFGMSIIVIIRFLSIVTNFTIVTANARAILVIVAVHSRYHLLHYIFGPHRLFELSALPNQFTSAICIAIIILHNRQILLHG